MEEKLHEPAKISTTQGARPPGLWAGLEAEGLAEEANSSERPGAEGETWLPERTGPVEVLQAGLRKGNATWEAAGCTGAHPPGTGAEGSAPVAGALDCT